MSEAEKRPFGAWLPSEACAFIEKFEGRRLSAYRCPADVWTIGVGHTEGVKEGDTCTDEQVDAWLEKDIATAQRYLARYVNVPVTRGQFVALVSLAFNVGAPYVVRHCPRLMRALNEGDIDAASHEFLDVNKVDGKEVAGLTRRRQAEAALFAQE